MVGIVVVSHSYLLGREIINIALDLMGSCIDELNFPLINASGLQDQTLGTNSKRILRAIEDAFTDEGVLILCDLGSSVLHTKEAINTFPDHKKELIRIADAPIVEGAIIAVISNSKKTTLISVLEVVEEAREFSKLNY